MFALEKLRGFFKRSERRRGADTHGIPLFQRHFAFGDVKRITVGLSLRASVAVEHLPCRPPLQNADIRGQKAVDAIGQLFGRNGQPFGVEMTGLPRRVNARVRPAAGRYGIFSAQRARHAVLQRLLHGERVFLSLPARIAGAVVREL